MIAAEIARGLERAQAALEAGDPAAATAALEMAQRACAAAASRGVRLPDAELQELRELHSRGEATARRLAQELARALEGAGSARRAAAAYAR